MFTSDASSFFRTLFSGTVKFFNLTVPGTNVTFLNLALGVAATVFVISLFKSLLGWSTGLTSIGSIINLSKDRSDRISKVKNMDKKNKAKK